MLEVRNTDIAKQFYEVADLMEIKGLNPFRIRAYRNAARIVENLPNPVLEMIRHGTKLDDLPGIGKDLAEKIIFTANKGTFPYKKQVEKGIPRSVLDLLKIPSLGPKRVALLCKKLRIRSLEGLERSCRREMVREIRGFGEKTEKRILDEICKLKIALPKRMKLGDAEHLAATLKRFIEQIRGIDQVIIAGSFRRRKETVGDLDILVTGHGEGSKLMEQILAYEGAKEVLSRGTTRGTMLVAENFQVDIRVIPKESLGAALVYFTGSKPHNIAIRTMGQRVGLKINEYGVFRNERRIAGETEQDVYRLLKLPYIEPELRENEGEIPAATEGRLPKLIELKDIRGDLHSHTVESDGLNTLEEMAQAAEDLGYEYLAITDHTKSLAFVKGLDKKRLLKQFAKIDKLNGRLKTLRILKSAEVDILEEGTLDFPDEILKQFDIVVCAVHSHFNLPNKKQTDRILRALENSYVNILAHPFGRLIGEREPIELDFEKIMDAMKSRNCVLEINAQPNRLDLPDHYCRMAGEAGIRFAISTDAHHTSQLGFMKFGIDVGRRGWLTKDQVINTKRLKSLMKSINRS